MMEMMRTRLSKKLGDIEGLREQLHKAEAKKCKCSDFTMKYEQECQCERGREIDHACLALLLAVNDI